VKNRLAIVVQRCGDGLVGGSEALAWQWAGFLSDEFDVDILTTTATDAVSWANEAAEGAEMREGITIRRFNVDIGRTPYWHGLHQRLLASVQGDTSTIVGGRRWTMAWQEEFIRKQGPCSAGLMEFLRTEGRQYSTIIFVTYLFPTTYFGLRQVEGVPRLLVPTVHDEAPAFLPAYREMVASAGLVLWNTVAEERLGQQLWGAVPGVIVGMAVETGLRDIPEDTGSPYILYSGRIDEHKGCDELLAYYDRFQQHHHGVVRLVLTGHDEVGHRFGAGVKYLGYVREEEKLRLMRGAALFCMPSPHESFSISSLEAMAQTTPVLATARSEVLRDHVETSGGGMLYVDYDQFERSILRIVGEPSFRSEMGARAREYVVANYSRDVIHEKLLQAVDSMIGTTRSKR
jgi:glycosyltransferase involved in cell wall biosynthesis